MIIAIAIAIVTLTNNTRSNKDKSNVKTYIGTNRLRRRGLDVPDERRDRPELRQTDRGDL